MRAEWWERRKLFGKPVLEIALETTTHGKIASYDGVNTGFDMKPVYNLYEEFLANLTE